MKSRAELYDIRKGMNLTQEMALAYESRSKRDVFLSRAPVIVRVKARGFEEAIYGLPEDHLGQSRALYEVFVSVAEVLVEKLHARVAYVWGREITLLLFETDAKKEIFCEGRKHMIDSVAAGLATSAFLKRAHEHSTFKLCRWEGFPHFEATSFEVPTLEIAAALLNGYQLDNRRNVAIKLYEAAAPDHPPYSPSFKRAIEGAAKAGLEWADLRVEVRRGAFLRRWKRPEPAPSPGLGLFFHVREEERKKQERPSALARVEHVWLHTLKNVEGWLVRHEAPEEDLEAALSAER